jgi:hypothetical protein
MFKTIYAEKGMAIGYVIPTNSPRTVEYLDNIRDYNDPNADIKQQMKLCNEIYRWEGVISNGLDILIEFAVSEMTVKGLDPVAKNVIDVWAYNINKNARNMSRGINSFNRQFGIEHFINGNLFPYKQWGMIEDVDRNNKKIKFKAPTTMILLNPMNFEIPEESVVFGDKQIVFKPPDAVLSLLQKSRDNFENLTKEEKFKVDQIPEDFKMKILDDGIVLDNNIISHIKRKGRSYLAWGTPYLTRCFHSVAQKRKLQALDSATTEGLINMIRIFKIGDITVKETWNPQRLKAFANLMKNPSTNLTLVWGPDVELLTSGPDGEILDFENKYKHVDNDILQSLGVPIGILTGEVRGDQFIPLAALLERLDEFREQLELFLVDTIVEILDKNGLSYNKYDISIFWKHSRLKNAKEMRELVLTMRDRGLFSIETAIEESGGDLDKEIKRRKEEKGEGLDELFQPPKLPWSREKPVGPDNSGEQPDTTKTVKEKPDIPDVKDNPKGNVTQEFFSEWYDNATKAVQFKIEKINNESEILKIALILPVKTDMLIRSMLNSKDGLGIKIDSLLEDRIDTLNHDFIETILEKKNKKDRIKAINTYKDNALDVIRNCIDFGGVA